MVETQKRMTQNSQSRPEFLSSYKTDCCFLTVSLARHGCVPLHRLLRTVGLKRSPFVYIFYNPARRLHNICWCWCRRHPVCRQRSFSLITFRAFNVRLHVHTTHITLADVHCACMLELLLLPSYTTY